MPIAERGLPVPVWIRSRIANIVTALSSFTTEALISVEPNRVSRMSNSRSMIPSTGSAVIEIVRAMNRSRTTE
jgi:hypothetical protein